MPCHLQATQQRFEDELLAGRYDYDAAVRAYKRVNEKRQRASSYMVRSATTTMTFWLPAALRAQAEPLSHAACSQQQG